jgi:glycerophosphoryl diester phosphodiesterase
MRSYILSVSKRVVVNYISSPEVSLLTSIHGRVNNKTKLVFRFLDETTLEPSTNLTYGSMLKNLTFVKTFASGILVPKHYILPVSPDNYLQSYTSVVDDAHREGLEIYAADFQNDGVLSYNYSYDPLTEYLSFIHNDAFSVDGVLTDFPITHLQRQLVSPYPIFIFLPWYVFDNSYTDLAVQKNLLISGL